MVKRFTPKLKLLKFFDQNEIVSAMDLVNWFPLTYESAKMRIYRMHKAGLVEPLGAERGKWVLSVEGYRMLNYHRKRVDIKRGE